MIVGHFLLAFVLVALFAKWKELGEEDVLILSVLAGSFAVIPDIDIVFAWNAVFVLFGSGMTEFVDSFWQASKLVHRGITHSLVTLGLATIGFSAYHKYPRKILAATLLLFGSISAYLLGNIVSAGLVALFVLAGLLITQKSIDLIDSRQFIGVAGLGLLSHPFGDIMTGTPPAFLYPLDITFLTSRVILFSDLVVNLLSIFLIELSLAAVGLAVYNNLKGYDLSKQLQPFTIIGILYAPVAFLIPAPTLEVAYQFVFSIIGFGLVISLVSFYLSDNEDFNSVYDKMLDFGFNLVTAMLTAFAGYTLLYISILV